jgi:hypothetical protein
LRNPWLYRYYWLINLWKLTLIMLFSACGSCFDSKCGIFPGNFADLTIFGAKQPRLEVRVRAISCDLSLSLISCFFGWIEVNFVFCFCLTWINYCIHL